MKTSKPAQNAKMLLWASVFLGIAAVIIGAGLLFVHIEDLSTKVGIFAFAVLGLIGMAIMIVGTGISSLFESLSAANSKDDEEESDDADILA